MIPPQIWWKSRLAEAYHRHLYPSRPCVRAKGIRPTLTGTWEYKPNKKRPWTIITRDIYAALRAVRFNAKQRHKKNVSLLFALAQWGIDQTRLPKMALRKYLDDGWLFQILKAHDETPETALCFGDLSPSELKNLEKRLHHHWPDVALMRDAMNRPKTILRDANKQRRNSKGLVHNPRQSVFSETLKQLNP